MATRKLEVQFIGDTKNLERAFGRVDKQGTSSFKALGKAAVVAGAAVSAGAVVALKGFADAASEAEKSNAKMRAQLAASGVAYGKHAAHIDKVIEKQSKLSALDDEDLTDSFTNIVRVTGNVNKALRLNALAADFARAKNIDVAKAGELVGKVAGGNTGILSRYGIQIREGASATEALGVLQEKFRGQAKAYGDTAAGANERFKVAVENLQESLGKRLLPALSGAAAAATKFVDGLRTGEGVGGQVADAFRQVADMTRSLVSGFRDGVGPARGLASALAAVVAGFVAFRVVATVTAGIAALKAAWVGLGTVMAANPFGALAVGIAALAAAFGVAQVKTRDATAAARDYNDSLRSMEEAMRDVRDLDIDLAQRRANVKSATVAVTQAENALAAAKKDHGKKSVEARQAEADLDQARISLERNTRDLIDAESDGEETRRRATEATKTNKNSTQDLIAVKEKELNKTEASIAQMVRAGHGYVENAEKAGRLRAKVETLKDEIAGLKNKRFDVTADVKFTLPKGFKTEAASGDPRTLSEKFQAALQASAQGAANAGLFSPIVSGGFPGGTFKGGSWKYANRVAGMFGLRVSSSYRDPIRNAAAGGVPGSLHTHGSPANPGAIDMVGSPGAMYAASAWASRNIPGLRENLVHDAGSGLHLHLGFFKRGGSVPGAGAGDRVPAMLEPGEFVIRKQVVDAFGPTFFAGINGMKGGGQAKKKAKKTQAGMAAKAAPIWEALTAAAHGTRPLRAIEQSLALAELTETLGDDIAAMDERVRFWELRLGVARATGRGITGAAQNLKSARDARSGLTPTSVATTGVDSALDENNLLLARRNELDELLVSNQTKLLALAGQGDQILAAVIAAVNGGIGGPMGLGFHGIRTPVGNVANL